MNELAPPKFGMGASRPRLEDEPLVRGRGRYTTDVAPQGLVVGHVVRATVGHARFTLGDLEAARGAPGVHLVWTADDVSEFGPLPCLALGQQKDRSRIHIPDLPVLCRDTVRHVGDAIAFVVADDLNAAKSAAELIEIDYEPLPAVVETAAALAPDAPLVWPEHGSNLAFEYERGDAAATEAAFRDAETVARLRVVNNRVVSNYIETRAVVAEHAPEHDAWTLTIGSQGVHGMRQAVAKAMRVEEGRIRVLTPDVGGGFGTKAFAYREYPLAAKAAKVLGRPVKWVQDRNEHFMSCAQGRDNVAEAAFALDRDGRVKAMRVDLVANMGAYLSQFGPVIPWIGITMTTGVYDIPTILVNCKGVYTNTVPVDAYRGAGRPEAAYLVERLMDEAARVTGLSRTEIRRRNFIRPDQMPYKTAMGRVYDTGDFDGHMTLALKRAEYDTFEARVEESRGRGLLRGFGFATYIEACAFPGSELAKVVLDEDGGVTLHIGTQSNGQGHKTAYAQFIAGPLGLDYDRIRVVQGDSAALPDGGGTGGSRSIPLGVPSVDRASKALAEKLKDLAARELETATADIELVDGAARVAGTDRALTFTELAARAPDEAARTATGEFKSDESTYPNGTHVCELEIDPETGRTEILRYTIVDDFGVTVNPVLLAGQVHGGVAQGIGQALLEHTVYDEDGQLVTATFNDYTMPRADHMPAFGFETRNIPSTWNPLGIKGAGEAGTIGAAPAVMNAVVDALHRGFGIRHVDMPATPRRIWEAIEAVRRGSRSA